MHRRSRIAAVRRFVRLWPLLAAVGLLIVPVECARVGHPHSLFQTIPIAGTDIAIEPHDGHTDAVPHPAHEHTAIEHGIPAWASPLEFIEPAITTAPALEIVAASVAPLRTVLALTSIRDNLPQLEPVAPVAEVALGTPLAAVAALFLLIVHLLRSVTGQRSSRLRPFVSLLEPPPPRIVGVML